MDGDGWRVRRLHPRQGQEVAVRQEVVPVPVPVPVPQAAVAQEDPPPPSPGPVGFAVMHGFAI